MVSDLISAAEGYCTQIKSEIVIVRLRRAAILGAVQEALCGRDQIRNMKWNAFVQQNRTRFSMSSQEWSEETSVGRSFRQDIGMIYDMYIRLLQSQQTTSWSALRSISLGWAKAKAKCSVKEIVTSLEAAIAIDSSTKALKKHMELLGSSTLNLSLSPFSPFSQLYWILYIVAEADENNGWDIFT